MHSHSRWLKYTGFGVGLVLMGVTGCQTHFGGMTLPSPHYLKHRPQYFPPDPTFPLQREVDSQQDPDGALRRGAEQGGVGPALGPIAPVGQPIPAGR